MLNLRRVSPVLLLVAVTFGCGGRSQYTSDEEEGIAGTPGGQCTPGVTQDCLGAAGCRSKRICGKDGRWGICTCTTGATAGTGPSNPLGQGGQPETIIGSGGTTYFTAIGSSTVAPPVLPGLGGAPVIPNPSGGISSGGTGVGGIGIGGIGVGGLAQGGTSLSVPRGGGSSKGGSSAQGGKGGTSTAIGGGSNVGGSYVGGSFTAGTSSSKPNNPPVITKLTLTPNPVRTNDTLSVNIEASDPDGDKISHSYAWTNNGKSIGSDSSRLSGWSYFSKGESITVTVTPSDGKVKGTAVTSAAIIVDNAPPEMSGSPYVLPSSYAGDEEDLTCQPPYSISDPDNDTVTTQYQWYRKGVAMSQTGATLLAANTAIGDFWSCQVIASDGTTSTKGWTSSETQIVNRVKGIFRTDTTWTAANSPYYLADRVQIAAGATLKIEPGVTVYGQGYSIESWGTINMAGTKEKPIIIDNVMLIDNSAEATPGKVDLSYVEWDYGTFLASTMNATVTVSDCVFESLNQPIFIYSPVTTTHVFQRNVFRNGWGIQSLAPLKLYNNVFNDNNYYYYPEVSVSDTLTATNNSFLSTNKTLVVVGAKNVDIANNYWGGLIDSKLPDHITDNNDDLNIVGAATYLPTSATAHASTPSKDKTYR